MATRRTYGSKKAVMDTSVPVSKVDDLNVINLLGAESTSIIKIRKLVSDSVDSSSDLNGDGSVMTILRSGRTKALEEDFLYQLDGLGNSLGKVRKQSLFSLAKLLVVDVETRDKFRNCNFSSVILSHASNLVDMSKLSPGMRKPVKTCSNDSTSQKNVTLLDIEKCFDDDNPTFLLPSSVHSNLDMEEVFCLLSIVEILLKDGVKDNIELTSKPIVDLLMSVILDYHLDLLCVDNNFRQFLSSYRSRFVEVASTADISDSGNYGMLKGLNEKQLRMMIQEKFPIFLALQDILSACGSNQKGPHLTQLREYQLSVDNTKTDQKPLIFPLELSLSLLSRFVQPTFGLDEVETTVLEASPLSKKRPHLELSLETDILNGIDQPTVDVSKQLLEAISRVRTNVRTHLEGNGMMILLHLFSATYLKSLPVLFSHSLTHSNRPLIQLTTVLKILEELCFVAEDIVIDSLNASIMETPFLVNLPVEHLTSHSSSCSLSKISSGNESLVNSTVDRTILLKLINSSTLSEMSRRTTLIPLLVSLVDILSSFSRMHADTDEFMEEKENRVAQCLVVSLRLLVNLTNHSPKGVAALLSCSREKCPRFISSFAEACIGGFKYDSSVACNKIPWGLRTIFEVCIRSMVRELHHRSPLSLPDISPVLDLILSETNGQYLSIGSALNSTKTPIGSINANFDISVVSLGVMVNCVEESPSFIFDFGMDEGRKDQADKLDGIENQGRPLPLIFALFCVVQSEFTSLLGDTPEKTLTKPRNEDEVVNKLHPCSSSIGSVAAEVVLISAYSTLLVGGFILHDRQLLKSFANARVTLSTFLKSLNCDNFTCNETEADTSVEASYVNALCLALQALVAIQMATNTLSEDVMESISRIRSSIVV